MQSLRTLASPMRLDAPAKKLCQNESCPKTPDKELRSMMLRDCRQILTCNVSNHQRQTDTQSSEYFICVHNRSSQLVQADREIVGENLSPTRRWTRSPVAWLIRSSSQSFTLAPRSGLRGPTRAPSRAGYRLNFAGEKAILVITLTDNTSSTKCRYPTNTF